LLAGRKLLLADDSITIQKVVDLTFADEGVSVVCVDNGREAIEWLEQFTPDVVLADVFMPQMTGYEVCEYIKQSEKLKHIPVMLLVGSFEPFDEGEARRVGANDTLTKPFQSIRRLIDKVGLLVSGRSAEEQIPTAELPKPEAKPEGSAEPEVEKLTTAELEITTADTRPLPPELRDTFDGASALASMQGAASVGEVRGAELRVVPQFDQGTMESKVMDTRDEVAPQYEGAGEVLLDLGDFQAARALDEDFVLDIDLDEAPESSPEPAFASAGVYSRRFGAEPDVQSATATITADPPAVSSDQMAVTEEFHQDLVRVMDEPSPDEAFPEVQVMETPVGESTSVAEAAPVSVVSPAEGSAQQLSPELIDAIARRVIEHMSEKVVQEIAWEVVPELAELLIKRQLEEKNS
jgi:CheY-like chemotaxis protein